MTMAAASDDEAVVAALEVIALGAGRLVMEVFNTDHRVRSKVDQSPVTEADHAAEHHILTALRQAFPHIPCVAEEEVAAGIVPGYRGVVFFLVDPLDGTKEFINRHTDFTVNIGLVRDGVPVAGVVYAPCTRRFYAGRPGHAEAIEVDPNHEIVGRRHIHAREGLVPYTIVASRSHGTPETDAFIRKISAAEIVSVGSSLKFCLIAAGEADVYPRFGTTMEWDTAAGDAVLRAAGGLTVDAQGQPLTYGKRGVEGRADFTNPSFIAQGRGVELAL